MYSFTLNDKINHVSATVILFFCFFQALGQEEKVTIQGKGITLEQAFMLIEKQTSYTIAYNQTLLNDSKKLDLKLIDIPLDSALTLILGKTDFIWKFNGKHIIVRAREKKKTETTVIKQTIRGVVVDRASGEPVPYATVILLNSKVPYGATTDSIGQFHMTGLPLGRYDVKASSIGYEPAVIREVLLTSAKETFCRLSLEEQLVSLEEVIVQAPLNKGQTLNSLALTGGRMVSMEEAGRYAGGFDDPARLVTSFAGVAGNFTSNSIAVRGNSPQFLQWKLEGVEVPNPTHFADVSAIGGGIFSALSSQVMGNSDFFNGAFPAEYSNALSGVFDMSMRTGNKETYEHTISVGTLGIDVASEGPFSKKHQGSYIFNYRYSTTNLVKSLIKDLDLKYQDLSFKLNFPTRRAGTFSVWGIALKDANQQHIVEDTLKWESVFDRGESKIDMTKISGGINHKYLLPSDAYIKTSVAATLLRDHLKQDLLTLSDKKMIPTADVKQSNYDLVLSSYINKKFGPRHTNRTGFTMTGLLYDMNYKMSPNEGLELPMEQIAKGSGFDAVISFFSSSLIRLSTTLTINAGLAAQLFTLNNHWTLEPRFSLRWKLPARQSLSFAYGLHSRHERLDYYYVQTPQTGNQWINKDLDFAKAHHFVMSYSYALSPNIHLKIEPYYQLLFDIPVEPNTSFSIINHDMWYLDRPLVNAGRGRNYGVDITLERYLNKGYYYLFTGSVFKSEYQGGDKVWRSTRMNRGFLFNALGGKEWMCGRHRQNVFSANLRLSYQGGDHYTPLDPIASEEAKNAEFDETKAFSKQFPAVVMADITLSYRINRKKVGHEFGIKLLNVTGSSGIHGYLYNLRKGMVEKQDINGMFLPNISYKIQF